jgi:putative hydrolase of the HAD superfamily
MRINPLAIIFDYGQVLSGPQEPEDIQAMADLLDVPAELFVGACWRYRLAYDLGELSPTRYWTTVAEYCTRTLQEAQIDQMIDLDNKSWTHPNRAMAAWAREIRAAGLRTAILSNMPRPIREYLDRQCAWLPEFDQRTFSCDVGSAKPMPEIYARCLNGLRLEPSQVLFLDDREENVRAAQELGMHTILFTDAEEAGCELENRFSIPVPLRS